MNLNRRVFVILRAYIAKHGRCFRAYNEDPDQTARMHMSEGTYFTLRLVWPAELNDSVK